MDPITGAMVVAGIGGGLGLLGQSSANSANKAMAREQMAFQERMSNTAYQRMTADMQLAGLNPMLAYDKAGGASTPPGATARIENEAAAGVSSASNALAAAQGVTSIQQTMAQTALLDSQREKVESETLPRELFKWISDQRGWRDNSAAALARRQETTEAGRPEWLRAATDLQRNLSNVAGVKLDLDNTSFSADHEARKARSDLLQSDVARARAEEKFYQGIGEANPYLRQVLMFLKAINSAGSVIK